MLEFVLALMAAIHPKAPATYDAPKVAAAIADVVAVEDPLPGMTRERTMAILTVTAWHESRFMMRAIGDNGIAFCAMQIHGSRALLRDAKLCVKTALDIMRKTMPTCPRAPLAPYIGGCRSQLARSMSTTRLAQAERIERTATAKMAEKPEGGGGSSAAATSSSP
jgi:hypothetical protein